MKPLLLDLFCGAGGASMGYHKAGFKIVGVDIEDQPRYPFEFHQADALEFSLEGFDVIHASPPCQRFSRYRRGMGINLDFPNLIDVTRQRLMEAGVPYVIENVPGAPLRATFMLCGSSFGLDIQRHRLFETSFDAIAPPCDHSWQEPRFPKAEKRSNLRKTVEVGSGRVPMWMQNKAMDIHWMTRTQIAQAVPPAYTHWIGTHLMEVINNG